MASTKIYDRYMQAPFNSSYQTNFFLHIECLFSKFLIFMQALWLNNLVKKNTRIYFLSWQYAALFLLTPNQSKNTQTRCN